MRFSLRMVWNKGMLNLLRHFVFIRRLPNAFKVWVKTTRDRCISEIHTAPSYYSLAAAHYMHEGNVALGDAIFRQLFMKIRSLVQTLLAESDNRTS
jgi:hypothetical protein